MLQRGGIFDMFPVTKNWSIDLNILNVVAQTRNCFDKVGYKPGEAPIRDALNKEGSAVTPLSCYWTTVDGDLSNLSSH